MRDVRRVPVIEQRHDILLQQVVERFGFNLVLVARVGVLLAAADGPAGFGSVALIPPAVQNRQFRPPLASTFMPLVPLAS